MTAIPTPNQDIVALIDAAHEQRKERGRSHLGPSQLGHPCDRWLWLSFRWAVVEKFKGRTLRIFRRGQNEESVIVSDLRAIGMNVQSTGVQQSRVDFGKHVGGSIDGIARYGVPGYPNKPHVLEFKTHSRKSFDELVNDGVEKSKPMHFAQCQLYMHGTKIDRALYIAVCKDDDRMHVERLKYSKDVAEWLVSRGHRITMSERMPEPCPGAAPDWYQCKFCPAHVFCHETRLTQQVNCRTCAHSTPREDSAWTCERHGGNAIPREFQYEACDSHVLHPDLVPWQLMDSEDSTIARYKIGEAIVSNGDPDATVFSSRELVSNPEACANPDEFIQALRERFDARIDGHAS